MYQVMSANKAYKPLDLYLRDTIGSRNGSNNQ